MGALKRILFIGIFLFVVTATASTTTQSLENPPKLLSQLINYTKSNLESLSAYAYLLTAFGFFVSLFIAIIGYTFLRHTEKNKLTMQMLSNQIHDNDIVRMFDDFRYLRQSFGEEFTYAKIQELYDNAANQNAMVRTDSSKRHPRDTILQVLNYYESWGIGVTEDALSEKILKKWWRTSLVCDWIDLYFFIQEFRDEIGSTFMENFEYLATNWASEKEKAHLKKLKSRYETGDYPYAKTSSVTTLENSHEVPTLILEPKLAQLHRMSA